MCAPTRRKILRLSLNVWMPLPKLFSLDVRTKRGDHTLSAADTSVRLKFKPKASLVVHRPRFLVPYVCGSVLVKSYRTLVERLVKELKSVSVTTGGGVTKITNTALLHTNPDIS